MILSYLEVNLYLFNWKQFYGEDNKEDNKRQIIGSKTIVADSGGFYISESVFEQCRSDIDGGAIYWNKQNIHDKLLVENTIFISCCTQSNGGAISFTSEGQCILSRVCGFRCFAFGGNQFCSIKVTNDGNNKNEIHESSICFSTSTGTFNQVVYLQQGNIIMEGLNGSNTNVHMDSFEVQPTNQGSGLISATIKDSIFSHNNARFSICIRYEGTSTKFLMERCNVISNKQAMDTHENGIIFTYQSELTIKNTCILLNEGNYIIDAHDGKLILDGCSIDFELDKCKCSDKTHENIGISYVNPILGFETNLCQASYEYAGHVTPIGFTPPTRVMECFTRVKRRVSKSVNTFSLILVYIS